MENLQVWASFFSHSKLHTNSLQMAQNKDRDRRDMMRSVLKKDEGVYGESARDLDAFGYGSVCDFPDVDTPNKVFDGVRFTELPILNIHVSRNNSIMVLTDHKGKILTSRSCGQEGFKKCRKGTNIAAQTTGLSFSTKLLERGFKTVRVMIKGLGPGRMSSVKGLQMGGLNIISITDATPVDPTCNARPPAARSL